MMGLKQMMVAAAAMATVAAPTMASAANPAASLSVARSARAGTPAAKANELAGGFGIVGLLLAAGVIAIGVIAIVNDEDDDAPDSN